VSSVADWITAGGTTLLGVSAALAAVLGGRQIGENHKIAKIDRTLDFHRDFDLGEVHEARHRLLDLLWYVGAEGTDRRVVCYQPLFNEFLPASPSGPAGGLAAYRADGINVEHHRPLEDVLLILGTFQRLNGAKASGTLDHLTFRRLFGHELLWWNDLFRRIVPVDRLGHGDTPLIKSLRTLADEEVADRESTSERDVILTDPGVDVRRLANFVLPANCDLRYPGLAAPAPEREQFRATYVTFLQPAPARDSTPA
jgi:hypothetical protein